MAFSSISYPVYNNRVRSAEEVSAGADENGDGRRAILRSPAGREFAAVQLTSAETPPPYFRMDSPFRSILDGLQSPSGCESRLSDRTLLSPVIVGGARSISPHSMMLSPDVVLQADEYFWMLANYVTDYVDGLPMGQLKAGHLILISAIKTNNPEILKRVLERSGAVGFLLDIIVAVGGASQEVIDQGHANAFEKKYCDILDLLRRTDVSPDMLAEIIKVAILRRSGWVIETVLQQRNARLITPQKLLDVLEAASTLHDDQGVATTLLHYFLSVFGYGDFLGVALVNAIMCVQDDSEAVSRFWKDQHRDAIPAELLGRALVGAANSGLWWLVDELVEHPNAGEISGECLGPAAVCAMRSGQSTSAITILDHDDRDKVEPGCLGQVLEEAAAKKLPVMIARVKRSQQWSLIPKEHLLGAAIQAIRTSQWNLLHDISTHPNYNAGSPEAMGINLVRAFRTGSERHIARAFQHPGYELIPGGLVSLALIYGMANDRVKLNHLNQLIVHPRMKDLSPAGWSGVLSTAIHHKRRDLIDAIMRESNLAVRAPEQVMGGVNYLAEVEDSETLQSLLVYLIMSGAPAELVNRVVKRFLESEDIAAIEKVFLMPCAEGLRYAYFKELILLSLNKDAPLLLQMLIGQASLDPAFLCNYLDLAIVMESLGCATYLMELLAPAGIDLAHFSDLLPKAITVGLTSITIKLLRLPIAGQCSEEIIWLALQLAIALEETDVVEQMSHLAPARRLAARYITDQHFLRENPNIFPWLRLCLGLR